MKIKFVHPADTELDETISYYNYELPGLGFRFLHEVEMALKRITTFPRAWTKIGENTMRCMLKGFPYALLYIIENNTIIISAVANLHRNPEHFKDRIM